MIHPKDLTIYVWHVKSQASQMIVEQIFLPNLKLNTRITAPLWREAIGRMWNPITKGQ